MDSFADNSDNHHWHALPLMANKLRGAIARKERRPTDPCVPSAAFLSRVKGYDFASCSDLELRQRISQLKTSSASSGDSVPLTEVFAIVNEAVERRMGAWRLFEFEGTTGRFARYQLLAIEAIASPVGLKDFAGNDRVGAVSRGDFIGCLRLDALGEGFGQLKLELATELPGVHHLDGDGLDVVAKRALGRVAAAARQGGQPEACERCRSRPLFPQRNHTACRQHRRPFRRDGPLERHLQAVRGVFS